jgi:hypothetical protein
MALVEVAHDPFAPDTKGTLVPVTHDPFAKPKFEAQADTVYSPEGIALTTPTTQGEPTGAAGTIAKTLGSVVGAPVRAAMSMAKPATNVMSWMGVEEPAKAIKQIDTGIKSQGPELPIMGSVTLKDPIGSTASFAGDMAAYNKILGALGKTGTAIGEVGMGIKAAPWLQSTLGGAAVGVLGAESPLKAIEEGGIGAALGLGTHGVLSGLGSAIAPVLPRIKDMLSKGFTLDEIKKDATIGQMFGGSIQAMENFFAAMPFSAAMPKVQAGARNLADTAKTKAELMDIADTNMITGMHTAKKQRLEELKNELDLRHGEWDKRHDKFFTKQNDKLTAEEEKFSIDQINKVLSQIGEKLPKGYKGPEAIKFAQERVGEAYKTPLKEIGEVRVSPEFEVKLKNLAEQHKNDMVGTDNAAKLDAEVNKLIAAAGESRILSADQWHILLKSLGTKANNYTRTGDPEKRELGMALKDVRSEWADLVDNEGIKIANKAHSLLQPVNRAASYIKSVADQGGMFDPKQYLNAIKSEASSKRFAAGAHPEQANAVAAYEKMVADREKLKAFQKEKVTEKSDKKAAEHEAVDKAMQGQLDRIKQQETYLKERTSQKQKDLKAGVKEATGAMGDIAPYYDKRLLYQGMGITGTGGLGTAGHFTGITPEMTAMALGIPWAASNALYRFGGQDLIKNLALKPRSEAVKQLGTAVREGAPAGALTTVEEYKQARQRAKGNLP